MLEVTGWTLLRSDIFSERGTLPPGQNPIEGFHWDLWQRESAAGESFSIRTEKYVAPVILQGTVPCDPDSDGDGIPDDEDACPNSIMSETVVIEDCDSGVVNILFDDGCTLADLIQQIADDTVSFGEFVSGVSRYAKELRTEGILSAPEAAALISCAASSN
jgi:hypothetical protein